MALAGIGPDLGACSQDYSSNSLIVPAIYKGSITNVSRLTSPDFTCGLPCSDFNQAINSSVIQSDPLKAISYDLPSGSSLSVPGTQSVCEELVDNKHYVLCKTNFLPSSSDVLFCMLDTESLPVHSIDMNTYLVRADAVYDFHDVTTTTFTVENCNAI